MFFSNPLQKKRLIVNPNHWVSEGLITYIPFRERDFDYTGAKFRDGYDGQFNGITDSPASSVIDDGFWGSSPTLNGTSHGHTISNSTFATGFTNFTVRARIMFIGSFSGNPRIVCNSHTDSDNHGFQLIRDQVGGRNEG